MGRGSAKDRAIVQLLIHETVPSSPNKVKHDAEIPDTDDAYLLARAKKATDFVNGKAGNPFRGLPQNQLVLIVHDESGAFTVNERSAAWAEAYRLDQLKNVEMMRRSDVEYSRTGRRTGFFKEILAEYRGLSPTAKAMYPENYDRELQFLIARELNSPPGPHINDKNNQQRLQTLLELLFGDHFKQIYKLDFGVGIIDDADTGGLRQ